MSFGPYFATDPLSLTLAADHAFTDDLAGPDIVWQLDLEPSQPLSLRTSLGLQAQSFRVFPFIGRNKHIFQNLNEFLTSPRVDSLWGNYASISLSPDANTQAVCEFWAREPYAMSGRLTLRNTGTAPCRSPKVVLGYYKADGTLIETNYIEPEATFQKKLAPGKTVAFAQGSLASPNWRKPDTFTFKTWGDCASHEP